MAARTEVGLDICRTMACRRFAEELEAIADEAAAKSILKATRIAALAVALSAMPALGAALEHASQKELDQCKLEASRATDNPQADSGRQGGKPKALDIL